MLSPERRTRLFAALFLIFVAGVYAAVARVAPAESSVPFTVSSPFGFDSKPACEVIGKGWKRHVYRPWLDTSSWYVEADKPDVNGFQYSATVRYNGDKTVREVFWDYIFINPSDGSEVSRHSFESAVKLKHGRVKELTAFSVKAPTSIVNASSVGADGGPQLIEKVSIRWVVYEDGSMQSF
jgi:hypothetical protein